MTSRQFSLIALKGFGMGAANVVPGVSGGTIALLTGIYSEIVDALSALTDKQTWQDLLHGRFKDFWTRIHGPFLLALFVGLVVSVFSLAKLMTWALHHYPILTWAFFFGLILSSAYYMLRAIKGWKLRDVLLTLGGVVLGIVVCTLSPTHTPDDMWFLFVCGAVSVCTMILPGVSGSFVLIIMGKYDYVMDAVSTLNIPVLVVFALGCVVGLLAFAKLLHWLLARWERQTMLVLVGFVLGSLVRVWPWADMEAIRAAQLLRTGAADPVALQVPGAIVCALLGIALVVVLEILGAKNKKEAQ